MAPFKKNLEDHFPLQTGGELHFPFLGELESFLEDPGTGLSESDSASNK